MTIEDLKQLDDILADETNVKNIERTLGTTEEGPLTLNYNRRDREYTFVLPNRTQKAKDETVVKLLNTSV